KDADLADLFEELRIPSVSTLPERRDDCIHNANWLKARLDRLGMKTEVVDVMEGGLPVVVSDWNGRPAKPHLTIYGHYDVQPPDPLDEWESPPFEPEVRKGRIYARGCDDKKGHHLATVQPLEHLFAARQPTTHASSICEAH